MPKPTPSRAAISYAKLRDAIDKAEANIIEKFLNDAAIDERLTLLANSIVRREFEGACGLINGSSRVLSACLPDTQKDLKTRFQERAREFLTPIIEEFHFSQEVEAEAREAYEATFRREVLSQADNLARTEAEKYVARLFATPFSKLTEEIEKAKAQAKDDPIVDAEVPF